MEGSDARQSFVHLHQHTEFSMLDGAARIGELVDAAAADGQPALAITDHGNMYGVLDFYAACHNRGVAPIIGLEAYMARESRHERPVRKGRLDDTGGEGERGEKLYYHLTLLAENDDGYHNLMKLASDAYLEGYYYKPRVDWELLERHHEGLIAATGCLGGVVTQALLLGQPDQATDLASRLQGIFGKDNLFVELQDHGLTDQRRVNPALVEIAHAIGAPLLATNDAHYCRREDAVAHDALLCVQTGTTIDDPKRFKFEGSEHYLKSASEMRSLFKDHPDACDNTLWIAERANVEIELGKPTLPEFPLPEGFNSGTYEESAMAYLRHLTEAGATERYGLPLPEEVASRLSYELSAIEKMGFAAYFLVVWDLIHHARTKNIRVGPGRGSAAGCLVAYCLRIVDIDPIRYGLVFERFLNPGRKQMPDIDMDFDERFRAEMIAYASEKYGWDHVAQIVTFSTIKARAAVRDAARVLGMPYAVGDRVAKAMPPIVMGRDAPMRVCFEKIEGQEAAYAAATGLREMYAADPDARTVIDVARGLEGLRRQDGIHAAAVVITKEPLTEYLPIQRKPEPGSDPADAPIVTQYEMHGVEALGLLKMDFLGLRNLSVIETALDLIAEATGERPDIDAIPLDDELTYEMLRRGDSIGVFQLEGGAMRTTLRALAPTCFDDVAALVALYRPGPMAANMHRDYPELKNGRMPISYLHADMEDVLADTYGLMLYQESVMRVAERFAGYSLEEADNLRKACLPAGTRLLTRSRGYFPIEKLKKLADRQLQTIDTVSATIRFEELKDVWSVGVRPVYRLTTSTGYSIEATAEHRFLVEEEWKTLEEITVGNLVGVAARISTNGGSHISMDEIELSALLISEGYTPDVLNGTPGNPHFSNTDPELIEIFCAAFTRRFGRAPRSCQRYARVTRVRMSNAELMALSPCLGSLGLSADKSIPALVVNAPKLKVERFLALYFCADGWADRSGAHFGSKSKAVCLSLKRMLLRFGILSNLHSNLSEYGIHWTLSIADKGQAKAFAQLVSPHLTESKAAKVDRWLTEWGSGASATNIGIPTSFLLSELERRSEVSGRSRRNLGVDSGGWWSTRVLHRETLNGLLYSERLEDLRTGDLVWDTVTSVDYVGERECFDFEMANPRRPYAVAEDFLVHNCGKKDRVLIAAERKKFIGGCAARGYGEELGTKLFNIIEPFADYAFNKSHAYGYGFVAYQTAWLKANHPVEYLAALLSSVKDDKDKTAVYLGECRARSIEVRVPDINTSFSNFTAHRSVDASSGPGRIVFGLSAVRNVGEGVVAQIVAERERNGPFRDFFDFCWRVDPFALNKRSVESLIKSGAFDTLGHPRKGLCLVFEGVIDRVLSRRREEELGISTLFSVWSGESSETTNGRDEADESIPDVEFDKAERLAFEKEMLGLYVSDHPLMGLEAALRQRTDATVRDLLDRVSSPETEGEYTGARVVGGVVTNLNRRYTRKGELMATFVLEDLESAIEVFVFPKTMQEYGMRLEADAIVCVRGRLDLREDVPKLVAMEITRPELQPNDAPGQIELSVPLSSISDSIVAKLKELVTEHPGSVPVHIRLGPKVIRLPSQFNVDPGNGLVGALKELLGANSVLA